MTARFEYKIVEVPDHDGLPGGGYSQEAIVDGFRAIRIFRSRRPYTAEDGTVYPDRGFIVIYERKIGETAEMHGTTTHNADGTTIS